MDYLRQLRNDEKRCTYSMVGTLDSKFASVITPLPLFVVPTRSTIGRVYAVTKAAFAAGSTVTVEIYEGSAIGTVLFTDLPIDTTGVVTISADTDTAGRYATAEHVSVTLNQAAVDSAVGEAQIVVEFTEVPVTAGAYTR